MGFAEIIALGSFLLNIVVAIGGFTIGLKKIGDTIEQKIELHRDKFESDLDRIKRETGESCAAIRAKIQEVELYIRDTYVRRDSFYETIGQYGSEMRNQFAKIETRLERMEGKIDTTKH